MLWNAALAYPLPEFIIRDIGRLAERSLYTDLNQWREDPKIEAAAPEVEGPLFRKELGLWEHQKYFVEEAFKAHRSKKGARLLLADQVGLGKTVQLAMSAKLMALWGRQTNPHHRPQTFGRAVAARTTKLARYRECFVEWLCLV